MQFTVRDRSFALNVDFIFLALALWVLCTGTWFFIEGAISNDQRKNPITVFFSGSV